MPYKDRIISDRNKLFSSLYNDLLNLNKIPLARAIYLLYKKYNISLEEIGKKVFSPPVSRQYLHRYFIQKYQSILKDLENEKDK